MKKSSRLFAWHHWLGLITGLLLLVVSISGAVLVFHKEIDALSFPAVAKMEQAVEEQQYDKALASVLERYPFHRLRLHLHNDAHKAIVFEARGEQNQRLLYVHPQNGHILYDMDRFSAPSRWLLKLHYTLFMGITGNFLLALLGISMILSLLTGLLVYRKRLLPVLLFREKFSLRSKRSFYSGTHRYLGVWSLLLNMVLAVTGIWIQVIIIGSNLSKPKTAAAPVTSPMVSLDKVMKVLHAEKDGFTPAFVALPADSLSPITVWGKSSKTNPLLPAYADVLKIETKGYTTVALELIEEQSLGKKLYSWVISLHFGSFGGLPVKLLYCLFGLAPAWLSISGWFLYRKRKKAQKQPRRSSRQRPLKETASYV